MNLIDREIEKFEKWWNAQGNRRRDLKLGKQFLADSLQRVIAETKKKCIEALPEERTEGILGILGSRHIDGVRNEGFNRAIQQAKQNIEEV